MDKITEAQVRELLELSERATPGPWQVRENKSFGVQSESKNIASCFRKENEHFIAAARNLLPALSESWLEIKGELERLRNVMKSAEKYKNAVDAYENIKTLREIGEEIDENYFLYCAGEAGIKEQELADAIDQAKEVPHDPQSPPDCGDKEGIAEET